jgi:hypothetical protein
MVMARTKEVAGTYNTSMAHPAKEGVKKMGSGLSRSAKSFEAKKLPGGLYKEVIRDKFRDTPYVVIQTSKMEYSMKLSSGPKALITSFHSNKKNLDHDVLSTLKSIF